MNDMKCQHEWEYFDEHDFPNGYEYEQVNIPHKRCRKCGKEYELFDGYGEYAKRWRKVEPWLPELHKLEQELIRKRKALDIAKDKLDTVRQYHRGTAVIRPDDIAAYCDRAIDQITALEEQKDVK